jgi:hypothetical protein
METELNDIMLAVLEYKRKCKKLNIDEDSMETILLNTLLSAGIEFSR